MLTGEAKRRYMCEYMRSYRAKNRVVGLTVRPITDVPPSVRTDPGSQERASPAVIVKTQLDPVRPKPLGLTAKVETTRFSETFRNCDGKDICEVKTQHMNPMMVGYVPLPR